MVKKAFLNIRRKKRSDKLLPILFIFKEFGEKEVSLSELLESVELAQKNIDFGYYFSSKILHSDQVFEELDKLKDRGYIVVYSYKHDGYFPKKFVSLTSTGVKRAQESLKNLPKDEIIVIKRAVQEAIKENKERYKIWSRPLFTERKQF